MTPRLFLAILVALTLVNLAPRLYIAAKLRNLRRAQARDDRRYRRGRVVSIREYQQTRG